MLSLVSLSDGYSWLFLLQRYLILSPFSPKEKQEQILHDNTVSQARSICSNLHTVIQVKKLALSWCLSQSVKYMYIQAPSVQFPLIFSLTCLFTNLL